MNSGQMQAKQKIQLQLPLRNLYFGCNFYMRGKQSFRSKTNPTEKTNTINRRKGFSTIVTIKQKQQPPLPVDYRSDVLERFKIFTLVESFKSIREMFKKLYGRHSPINYLREYNFKEQWEASKKQLSGEGEKGNNWYLFYAISIMVSVNVCLWSMSMAYIFDWKIYSWVYALVMAINLIEIIRTLMRGEALGKRKKLVKIVKEVSCLMVALFGLIVHKSHLHFMEGGAILLLVIFLNRKASKRYEDVKIFHISSIYRDYVNLFDLFLLLITVTHIFALALYSITLLHPNNNWITKVGISNQTWDTKYIYSLYFSCTTLLTVGYGDVSPVNTHQILMILVTQLIGIATFAYAVNQIGVALSSMQEKKEKTQKDLNNVENVGNTYRLDPGLVCRMRTELINNKATAEDMCVEEENQLLLKFSDDLRQSKNMCNAAIQFESSLKVIKRSTYMLINWTGRLQAKIATKLVKQIYSAQENLLQIPGKEKMYLIDQGRVQILNNSRMGYKMCFQKILKTIIVNKTDEVVLHNVFGYTSIISQRPIRLKATCKETSICYTLSKSDFYECLMQSEDDIQRFHELKLDIDLAKIPEEIEAPAIINIRQHYHPCPYFIIGMEKKRKTAKNRRKNMSRNIRRMGLQLEVISLDEKICLQTTVNKSKSMKLLKFMHSDHDQEEITTSIKGQEQGENLVNPMTQFEAQKEYRRYLRLRNCESVVQRLNSHNFTRRAVKKQ